MFDKKTKRGIIHHARQRRTESACRFEFEIHHFIYFPTPLYTKARCQAGFCVCWGFFLFEKSSGRQCTRPIEQLLSAATPPVKMQARKVRRLSGLVLSQNIIPLMIAGAQRRRLNRVRLSDQIPFKAVQVFRLDDALQIQPVLPVFLHLHAAALPHGGGKAQFIVGQQHL